MIKKWAMGKGRWAMFNDKLACSPGPRPSPIAHRPLIRLAVTTAALVAFGGSSSLLACPQCFGAEETPMIDGAKLGVLVLLVVTLAVQGAFLGFFLYLRKHAKRNAEVELDLEWSKLQRSPR